MSEDEAHESRVDLGVGDGGEAPSDRRRDRDGGEALLRVAVVLLEVLGGQRLDQAALLGVERAEGLEVVGQGAGLVAGSVVEGGHELGLVDQPDLEGQQAEEEVAVGGDGGHGEAPGCEAASDPAGHRAGARARGERRMGRIIAHGSVASIPADPVPSVPVSARLFAQKSHR